MTEEEEAQRFAIPLPTTIMRVVPNRPIRTDKSIPTKNVASNEIRQHQRQQQQQDPPALCLPFADTINPVDVIPSLRLRTVPPEQQSQFGGSEFLAVIDPRNIGLFMPSTAATSSSSSSSLHGQQRSSVTTASTSTTTSEIKTNMLQRQQQQQEEQGRLFMSTRRTLAFSAFDAFDRSLVSPRSTSPSSSSDYNSHFLLAPFCLLEECSTTTATTSNDGYISQIQCPIRLGKDDLPNASVTIQFASLAYHTSGLPLLDANGDEVARDWLCVRLDIALTLLDHFFRQPLSAAYLSTLHNKFEISAGCDWMDDVSMKPWLRRNATRGNILEDYVYIHSLNLCKVANDSTTKCIVKLATIEVTPQYRSMVARRQDADKSFRFNDKLRSKLNELILSTDDDKEEDDDPVFCLAAEDAVACT